jgi:hypothetical protein
VLQVKIDVRQLVREAKPEVVEAVMPQAESYYRRAMRQQLTKRERG